MSKPMIVYQATATHVSRNMGTDSEPMWCTLPDHVTCIIAENCEIGYAIAKDWLSYLRDCFHGTIELNYFGDLVTTPTGYPD
jgi:hypothetical protein